MNEKKVLLRELRIEDLENVMMWANDPEIVKNFAKFDHKFTREEEKKFIECLTKSKDDKVFSIFTIKGEYLGQAGLQQIHWGSKVARIALIIGNKKEWGKGYAQEALRELLRIAFEELKLHKLWVITFKENERMQHVMKKFGFKKEGIMKEEYYNKGEYHDVIRFALLEKEYFEMKEAKK